MSAFAVIGVLSTLAWLLLYLIFRTMMLSLAANALSLVVTTVANTAANRRFTFGVVGSQGALRHQLEGGIVFLIGLMLSSAGLGLVHLLAPTAPRALEVTAMLGSYALATVVRFVLLGSWVFHPRRRAVPAGATAGTDAVYFDGSTFYLFLGGTGNMSDQDRFLRDFRSAATHWSRSDSVSAERVDGGGDGCVTLKGTASGGSSTPYSTAVCAWVTKTSFGEVIPFPYSSSASAPPPPARRAVNSP